MATKFHWANTPSFIFERARKLRIASTTSERKLWKCLKSRKLEIRFRRQFVVMPFILDFYAPKLQLAIEIDGSTHCSEEEVEYDAQRTNFLKQEGIRILRFSNLDIQYNIDGVLTTIIDVIQKYTPPCPPACEGESDMKAHIGL